VRAGRSTDFESTLHLYSDHAITGQKFVPDYVHTMHIRHHALAVSGKGSEYR